VTFDLEVHTDNLTLTLSKTNAVRNLNPKVNTISCIDQVNNEHLQFVLSCRWKTKRRQTYRELNSRVSK